MSQITGSLVKLAHDEGFASGIAIACGIALNEFGEEVVVQEIRYYVAAATKPRLDRGALAPDIETRHDS